MQVRARVRWLLLMVTVLALSGCAQPVATEKQQAAEVEPIAGTDLKKVLLTEKAAERLGIETVPVRSEQIVRKRWVGGQVVALPAGQDPSVSAASSIASNEVRVRVKLSEGDLVRLDRAQPVAVRRVANDDDQDSDGEADELTAESDEDLDDPEDDDAADGAKVLYYSVSAPEHGLLPGQPVLVQMAVSGGSAERKIVPFSALIYGLDGETWIYTRPEPLAFVRYLVAVDYIEGEQVVLLEGPAVGTEIVTVGAAELFGVESGIGGGH